MNFENIVVFDIETIPDTSLASELCDIDDETIKKMTQTEIRKEMENYHIDNHNNSFLRQPFHRIVCISFLTAKIDNNYGKEEYIFEQLESYSSFKSSEEEVVKDFWALLEKKRPRIISFNGRMFDINVLKCKALKYGLDCKWYFNNSNNNYERYEYLYSNSHFDLWNRYGSYTLHEMCILLNIPCKLGVDGSRVAEYFDDKKYSEIREYCETDVLATYLVYLRMAFTQGIIDKNGYNQAIKDIEIHLEEKQNTKKGLREFLESWHKLNTNGLYML